MDLITKTSLNFKAKVYFVLGNFTLTLWAREHWHKLDLHLTNNAYCIKLHRNGHVSGHSSQFTPCIHSKWTSIRNIKQDG
jgi:hypothetical protein